MTTIRSEFYFEVESLWIEKSLLGSSIEFPRGADRIQICFPASERDFMFGERFDPASMAISGMARAYLGAEGILPIHVVKILVRAESTLTLADFQGPDHDTALRKGIAHWHRTEAVATLALRDLIEWARITLGQTWLGLYGELPRLRVPNNRMVDEESGKIFPFNCQRGRSIISRWHERERPIDSSAVADLSAKLGNASSQLPIAGTLLADALHYVCDERPSPQRAILMAAIACEVKVKQVLRERVSPDGRDLVELIISNPRDVSLAAAALFDKAMHASVRRSLRKENPELYKRVDRLFQIRNRIAHRGEEPPLSDAIDVVLAAQAAFEWLDGIT